MQPPEGVYLMALPRRLASTCSRSSRQRTAYTTLGLVEELRGAHRRGDALGERLEERTELPKTNVGKILHRELRDQKAA